MQLIEDNIYLLIDKLHSLIVDVCKNRKYLSVDGFDAVAGLAELFEEAFVAAEVHGIESDEDFAFQ